MKQFRTAFILLAILSILGGVAYWEEWKTGKDTAAEKEKNKLVSFKPDDVERFAFSYVADGKVSTIDFEQIDKKWFLTSPVRDVAEASALTSLFQTIADYKYESEIADAGKDLGSYGLAPPQRTLVFHIRGSTEPVTIAVGSKSPVGYSVYLKRSGLDKILVGGQQLYLATEKKLNDFRDKTFASIKDESVVGLTFKNKKINLILERKSAKDPYTFLEPKGIDADTDATTDFIASLTSEKAEEIIDHPSKEIIKAFSPVNRYAALTWKSADGKTDELIFAEHDKKLYAASKPESVVYRLNDSFKGKLDKDLMSFRNKSIVKFDSATVSAMDIDGVQYIKEESGDWKKKGEEKGDALTHLQSLVVDLEFARTDGFYEASKLNGLTKTAPKQRIKLGFKPDTKRSDVTIDIWPDPKAPNMVYVKQSESSSIYRVNQSTFNHTEKKADVSPPEHASGTTELDEEEEELLTPEDVMPGTPN